jgi:undecaprenyl phosphate N,N'-diacetylbacillosamine 1-phosphate transferase
MYKRYVKRLIDIAVASALLVATAPIVIVASVLIKIDSEGPIIFAQTRIGKDCRAFRLYKLRTMIVRTHDETGRKLDDKDRVTRVGRVIRRLSIDELPQLVNIIKGDMSFVGPRPLLVRYLPYYTDSELRRHEVRPGITGLAQINGRGFLQWEERFKYDLEYVDNLSFLLDAKILLRTVYQVLSGEGSSTDRPSYLVDFDEHRRFMKMR